MIRALGYSLIAAATLTACSGNDVKDTFAGIPVTSSPEGATVYVGRQKIGVTPMNIPDSAWERPGGRVGNTGILRVVAPGCQLKTELLDLAVMDEEAGVNLDCRGERYTPSDLSFLAERSVGQILGGIDKRVDQDLLDAIRMDEIHVVYSEGRLTDAEYRELAQ